MLLALGGCGEGPERVRFEPHLTCPEVIDCDIYQWRIGVVGGPMVGGLHIACACHEKVSGGYHAADR
jgi:hypothetical protein